MARAWRDQRLLRIGEGANEVVRLIIIKSLLRRGQTGRLPLDLAIADAPKLVVQTKGDSSDAVPAKLKTAALLLLGLAKDTFGEQLAEEQEVCAAIADVAAAAFVSESAFVRVAKTSDNSAGSDAARLYAVLMSQSALKSYQTVMGRIGAAGAKFTNPGLQAFSMILGSAVRENIVGLQRKLAGAVLEREGYPF